MNIAIDGPAGAGKSTIAKKIAAKLGYIYVDTGAMYRAMALYIVRLGIDPKDSAAISANCDNADISIVYEDGVQVVLLNGENVNQYLRTEEVGFMASTTSANLDVRKKLVALQQKLAVSNDVVMDGRDICTVVLPKAEVKVYLTASSAVRAKRRYDELVAKGESCDLAKIEEDIIARDYQDMNREHSPLRKASDATEVDSSYMTIDEVVDTIVGMVEQVK